MDFMNFPAKLNERRARSLATDSMPRRARQGRPLGGLAPLVVLVVALSVTALGTVFVSRVVTERDRVRFDDIVTASVRDLEERMQGYIDVLHAVAGLVALKPDLGSGEFAYFVGRLEPSKRYPDIQGIGWVPRVDARGKLELEAQHGPSFRVWPEGEREIYYPITVMAPQGSASPLGWDAATDPDQRATMLSAAATGDAVASGRTELPASDREGFLVYMPVYSGMPLPDTVRERELTLRGFVFSPFVTERLFGRLFEEARARQVTISVRDGRRLFYGPEGDETRRPMFETTRAVEVAGRTWTLAFATTPAFAQRSQQYLVPLVLIGGLLLSVLLTGITWSETRARSSAERATRELARSREALRQANVAKDEFLAMLGHELRNPIGALANTVRVMRLTAKGDPVLQRSLDIAARQVRHQTRLVDDLLDVSRMSTGKIRLQRQKLDLNEIVKSAASDAISRAREQRQTLALHPSAEPLAVEGDPVRLGQVVNNLLGNAIKYTPSGGRVDVFVEAQDGEAVVRVRDTGAGIDPQALGRVFELFAQDETTKQQAQGGLGIGLTLARQLIELHGGRIEATSEGRGRGSEFTIRLPRADGSPEPLEYEDSRVSVRVGLDERASAGITVLVIEDNDDARQMLCDLLGLLGHTVVAAADGQAGVDLAHQRRPDMALVDVGLPVMSGYEVARALRASPDTRGTLLVALTGYGQPEDRRRAFDAGFDEHLVKPLDMARLQELLARRSDDSRAGAG